MEYPSRSPSLTPGGTRKTRQYILLPSTTLSRRSSGTTLNQVPLRKARKKDTATSPSKAVKDKRSVGGTATDGLSLPVSSTSASGVSRSNDQLTSQHSGDMNGQGSSLTSSSHAETSESPRRAGNWRSRPSLKKPVSKGQGIGKGAAKKLTKSQNKSLIRGKANRVLVSKGGARKAHISSQRSPSSLPFEVVSQPGSQSTLKEPMELWEGDVVEEDNNEGLSSGAKSDMVYGLPRSLLQDLFCLYSKKPLTAGAMDLVQQFVERCVSDLCVEMAQCADQARRNTVIVEDVIELMKRRLSVSNHGRGWEELVHAHLPLDYAQILLPCSLIRDL